MLPFLLALSMSIASTAFADLRPAPSQFEFNELDNQSGLQKTDVEFLFQVLNSDFGGQISNQSVPFWSAFDWSKPYLGAGSNYLNGDFTILLWGGMVRAQGMTFGALAAMLCHEVGHYLGGEPRQSAHATWASAEGQADHFAATICLPKIYERIRQQKPEWLKQKIEKHVQFVCRKMPDLQKCVWVGSSGVDMIRLIQIYYDFEQPLANPAKPALEVPHETIVDRYPTDQCRMDTYVQGAACTEGSVCPRMRCWFRPEP